MLYRLPENDFCFSPWFDDTGQYQARERAACLAQVKTFDVAIDVGAHVGTWAIPLSHCFRTVVAFEANPENYSSLIENIAKCKAKNVIPIFGALWDKKTKGKLEQKQAGNSGDWRFTEETEGPIYTYRLDDFEEYFAELGSIRFIKIDVQGGETEVIEGGNKILQSNPHVIVSIEVDGAYDPQERAVKALVNLGMKNIGRCENDLIFAFPV